MKYLNKNGKIEKLIKDISEIFHKNLQGFIGAETHIENVLENLKNTEIPSYKVEVDGETITITYYSPSPLFTTYIFDDENSK